MRSGVAPGDLEGVYTHQLSGDSVASSQVTAPYCWSLEGQRSPVNTAILLLAVCAGHAKLRRQGECSMALTRGDATVVGRASAFVEFSRQPESPGQLWAFSAGADALTSEASRRTAAGRRLSTPAWQPAGCAVRHPLNFGGSSQDSATAASPRRTVPSQRQVIRQALAEQNIDRRHRRRRGQHRHRPGHYIGYKPTADRNAPRRNRVAGSVCKLTPDALAAAGHQRIIAR